MLPKLKIKGLRDRWIVKYLISEYHCIMSRIMPTIVGDEKAVKDYYKRITGNELDLVNPKTFCEKLNWYKLNHRDPLMQQCADKYAVREYVASKGYEDSLNELLEVYDKVSEIDINKLPEKFVLKATHGSHMNLIVKDKSKVNWFREKLMMRSWLHQNIYWSGREWVYKDIPRRIIAERYLEDESGELRDYKFFCFNGKPLYLEFDIGRFTDNQRRNYYDMNMNLLELSDGMLRDSSVKLPITYDTFENMKKIATDLSSEFPHVRVDLYTAKDKIYFGEMTFFDGGGSTVFTPDEWNVKFSEEWKI